MSSHASQDPRPERSAVHRRLGLPARLALVFLLAFGLALASPTRGQDRGQDPVASQGDDLSTFLGSVDVNVVNLEVFVTDGQGNAVTGLTRDDFEVRVDGEPTEITNFFVAQPAPGSDVDTARVDAIDPAAEAEAEAPAAAAGESSAAAPATPDRRPLFLTAYVDHVNILPGNRKRLLEDLRTLLEERVAAGDQVMLVGYDRSVEVVQPFTGNPQEVSAGIDRLLEAPTHRQLADTQLKTLIRRARQDIADQLPNAGSSAVAMYRQERENEAMAAYNGLRQMVTGLAGLPGRKALLYVSDGIPRYPGAEMAAVVFGAAPIGRNQTDLRRVYESVTAEANAHEVTLYTFDARGPNSDLFLGADTTSVTDFGNNADFNFVRDSNFQEPLMTLAEKTGGRAILNTNDFAGEVDALLRDFQSYYSLGFPSPAAGDGEYHRVEVRVTRPGVQVRHREGFLDKSAAGRVSDRTASFLLQGWESNPMGVELQFGAPKKQRRQWKVPVLVRVPAQAVTMIPRGEEMAGRLQLFVAVRDGEGRTSEVTRLERDVRIPTVELEKQQAEGKVNDLGYAIELEMRPGPQSMVVGVWDEVGGGESYVHQRVVIGGPS